MIRPNKEGIEEIAREHQVKHPPKPIDRPYADTTYLKYFGQKFADCFNGNGKAFSITGDVGIGKTLYCRYIVDELNENVKREYVESDEEALAVFCQLERPKAASFAYFLELLLKNLKKDLEEMKSYRDETKMKEIIKIISRIEENFGKLQEPKEERISKVIIKTEPSFPKDKIRDLSRGIIEECIKPLPIDLKRFDIEAKELFKELVNRIAKKVNHVFIFVDEWQSAFGKDLEDDFSDIFYDQIKEIHGNASCILIQNPVYAEERGSKTRLLAREGGHVDIESFSVEDVEKLCMKYLVKLDKQDEKDKLMIRDISYICRSASGGKARFITRNFFTELSEKARLTPKIVFNEISKLDVPSGLKEIEEWIPLLTFDAWKESAKEILRDDYDEVIVDYILLGDFKSIEQIAILTGRDEYTIRVIVPSLMGLLEQKNGKYRAKIDWGKKVTGPPPGKTLEDKLRDVELIIEHLKKRNPDELKNKIIRGFIELGGFSLD